MKEGKERIEQLLDRYFEARTTDAEERELRDYFRQAKDIPASLRYAQAMFGGMDGLAGEKLPAERMPLPAGEARREDARPVAAYQMQPGRRLRPLWGVAAAAVLALGLFLCVEYMRRPYCYIDGQAVYDKDVAMQTTVYLQGFSEFADPAHIVEELIMND